MGPGGAERVMAHLVSHLSAHHTVALLVWDTADTPSFYPLPDTVCVVRAGLLGGRNLLDRLSRLLRRFGTIRREARTFQPDVVLSFMDTMNITAIISLLGTGFPLVVSERVDPAEHCIGKGKSFSRRWLYPLATCCVVQTERVRNYFTRMPRPAIAVIPNPVPIPDEQAMPAVRGPSGRFRIIALGRLVPQKGFDLLIEAFGRVAQSHPDWDLVILGEGSMRAELESQIQVHALCERVSLPGISTRVTAELRNAHIMALPSRYEGFPNALAEALASGLPAVGFSGVSGVDELIIDNETGFLVNPKLDTGLSDALKRLMDQADLRSSLGARARDHMKNWRSEIICKQWELLLAGIVRNRRCNSADVTPEQ
jgi:GalNAc-alpha-(1->4)-GalNAc-alpha-(1->3)-diNAcBac-PP-undecaprenol alpha-1,4-N-acetyl-D-galactosaminyltransferase